MSDQAQCLAGNLESPMSGIDEIAKKPGTLWRWNSKTQRWDVVAPPRGGWASEYCKHPSFDHGNDDGDGRIYSACAWCGLREYEDES